MMQILHSCACMSQEKVAQRLLNADQLQDLQGFTSGVAVAGVQQECSDHASRLANCCGKSWFKLECPRNADCLMWTPVSFFM
jgi:hypothetical protein